MENTIAVAEKEIGMTSDINGAVNPRVLEYFKKCDCSYVAGDDQVWCAAFVGFVLETCGIESSRSLSARSYLDWGVTESVPTAGDVVVFWRDFPNSGKGHVSFFVKEEGQFIYCLGGNQGSGVVDIEKYPISRVLGYRSVINKITPTIMESNIANPEEVSSQDGKTEVIMPTPIFETVANTHYCMVSAFNNIAAEGDQQAETMIYYFNFFTDAENVIHDDTSGMWTAQGPLTSEAVLTYAQTMVEEGIIVKLNF